MTTPKNRMLIFILTLATLLPLAAGQGSHSSQATQTAKTVTLPNPILFVTQFPVPSAFITIGEPFGNHTGATAKAGRGGDLYILYPNGKLRNLTQLAGYGNAGHQGETAIGVRDPHVHWDGTKALFSMVIGAPDIFDHRPFYWQLYEVTGLGMGDTPVITKVPNQPANYNNIQGIYDANDRIIFVSDRPHQGAHHLYPLLDEYEETVSTTGLLSLDPASGHLFMLNHAPSGVFNPIIDSEGRVIFTRWDHLQRDQQADADALSDDGPIHGTFNYADETADAERLDSREEFFPEPRTERIDLLEGTNLVGHRFNRFLPWQINQDGTGEELVNHIGRQELFHFFRRSMNDDDNLVDFVGQVSGRFNQNSINNFFQMREDPQVPGRFIGIDAVEFHTNTAGQIIAMNGPSTQNPDLMAIEYLTHRDTATPTEEGHPPTADHSGMYRNPVILSDGTIIVAHTIETREDRNEGSRNLPMARYDFRLKVVDTSGESWVAGQALTTGISKAVSYYDPDFLVSYDGPFWELSPVEVVSRPRPGTPSGTVPEIEAQVAENEGIDLEAFKAFMSARNLALVVSRNVTTRDINDRQQPYNLRVSGTTTQTIAGPGRIYDVKYMQFFQADHLRGVGGVEDPEPGRRVLAQPMHDLPIPNPPNPSGPDGSVVLGDDGSMAAFVPARRAMTWQLTDDTGTGVVRERYWLNFQPGEVRVCASCHGVNTEDQIGDPPPENPPLALHALFQYWQDLICMPGPTDLDENGVWDIRDGILLMNHAGQLAPHEADLDCNGVVDSRDLWEALENWTIQ